MKINIIQKALFQQDFTTVLQLLKDGKPWNISDSNTQQALKDIIKVENFELLNLLIEKEVFSLDIFEYNHFRNSIFEIFTQIPFTDSTKAFLENIIADIENIDDELKGTTWLGLAISNNSDKAFIHFLIENGCDIKAINASEQTYLFKAKNVEITKFLIDQGIDINKKDLAGNTAFYEVVVSKNIELIQFYLDNGIDVNSQNNQGETVYDVLCSRVQDPQIFEQLVNYEPPRFDLKDINGQSLFLKIATQVYCDNQIEILKIMLNNGADLFQEETNMYGDIVTVSDILAHKKIKVLQMLNDNGFIDIEATDNKGNTWLHKVCMQELNFEHSKAKEMYKKVKLLIKAGANPNLKNDEDKSPIDYAQNDNLKAKALQLLMN